MAKSSKGRKWVGEKDTYGPSGEKIIDVYAENKIKVVKRWCNGLIEVSMNFSNKQIISALVNRIYEIGPNNISNHTESDLKKMNVFDIAPSSVSDPYRMHMALDGDKRVRWVLSKVNKPSDKAIHVEILQK